MIQWPVYFCCSLDKCTPIYHELMPFCLIKWFIAWRSSELIVDLNKGKAITLHFTWPRCCPQALVKRSPSSGIGSTLKESSAFQSELRMPDSAIRHQNALPSEKGKVTICDGKPGDEDRPKKSSVCKSIDGCQEELLAQVVRKYFFISITCVFLSNLCIFSHCFEYIALYSAVFKGLSFVTTGGFINRSSHTGNAHVSDGSHSDKLPTDISSGKQQSGSKSTEWIAHSGQSCGNDRSVNGMNTLLFLCSERKSMWCCRNVAFPQVPTLGSQEGAFENVRMNYSGDQGQTIRQLISAHVLRRVAMCVLSSPHGRRQHLAVSHEKGKVRI